MLVTIMGHAGLMIESGAARVLVDPILRTTPLASGSVEHTFGRSLDLTKLPEPTAIVVTHAHFDHFDPESLEKLPRGIPVVTPHDAGLIAQLRTLGFSQIVPLATWEHFRAQGLTLTATPAGTEVDELGILAEAPGARFWHMSDAEATKKDAEDLRTRYGEVHLLSAKYQPTALLVGQEFRCLGGCFDKAEVIDWLEAAAAAQPSVAFPYAAGVRFCGGHDWLNRFGCPFTQPEIAALLSRRLGPRGRAVAVLPGDVFDIVRGDVRHVPQASPFVRHAPTCPHEEPDWEPFHPEGWRSVETDEDASELERLLERTLRNEVAPWIASQLNSPDSLLHNHVAFGAKWELTVHVRSEQRLSYSLDFSDRRLSLCVGKNPRANLFTHIAGEKLLRALRGDYHPDLLFTLGDTRQYEKILDVRDGRLWAPPAQGWSLFERLPDPLLYYLRRYAPRGAA